MGLQAYVDDSADKNIQVLAGYVAPFDAWKAFTEEWGELLHNFHMQSFKMSQIARTDDGFARAEVFYRIIERHAIASVSCSVDKKALTKVVKETPRPPNVFEIDKLDNAYYPAFNGLLVELPAYQESMGISEPIDFIFDDQSEKVHLWNAWNMVKIKVDPTTRRLLGAEPQFKNDEDALPLQAGDLLAWWVRRWELEGCFDAPDYILKFPWERKQKMYHAHIRYHEHQLREQLEEILSERGLYLLKQSSDTLRQIDEGQRYEEEGSGDRGSHSPRSLLRRFVEGLRGRHDAV